MRDKTHSTNDVIAVVTALAAALFLLSAAGAMRKGGDEARRLAGASSGGARQSAASRIQRMEDQPCTEGGGKSDPAPPPPEAYQLPSIPGSRRVWHRSGRGMESWGFVTQRNAQEVGVSVLDHYEKLGGWALASSENLGLWASSWGCTVYRMSSKEVVMIAALPVRLGEMPGGASNSTRVSVIRVAGEEALRDVLGKAGQGGGEQR